MGNISSQIYALYERLASAKLNELINQLNSHNHGSSGGVTIDVATAIANGSITATMIQDGAITANKIPNSTITNSHIAAGTITTTELNLSSIHLVDGYAVYSS